MLLNSSSSERSSHGRFHKGRLGDGDGWHGCYRRGGHWREIVVMEVVDEDYLMEVGVVEEDCLMVNHVCFSTYHQLDLDRQY